MIKPHYSARAEFEQCKMATNEDRSFIQCASCRFAAFIKTAQAEAYNTKACHRGTKYIYCRACCTKYIYNYRQKYACTACMLYVLDCNRIPCRRCVRAPLYKTTTVPILSSLVAILHVSNSARAV